MPYLYSEMVSKKMFIRPVKNCRSKRYNIQVYFIHSYELFIIAGLFLSYSNSKNHFWTFDKLSLVVSVTNFLFSDFFYPG